MANVWTPNDADDSRFKLRVSQKGLLAVNEPAAEFARNNSRLLLAQISPVKRKKKALWSLSDADDRAEYIGSGAFLCCTGHSSQPPRMNAWGLCHRSNPQFR